MNTKYQKKPVVIDAFQWTSFAEQTKMPDWIHDAFKAGVLWFDDYAPITGLYVRTLEGNMKVSLNDYIIKGVEGELYPCKPNIFLKTYDMVLPTINAPFYPTYPTNDNWLINKAVPEEK